MTRASSGSAVRRAGRPRARRWRTTASFPFPVFELLRDYIARRQREGALLDYIPALILVRDRRHGAHFAIIPKCSASLPCLDEQVVEIFTAIMMSGIQPKKERVRK